MSEIGGGWYCLPRERPGYQKHSTDKEYDQRPDKSHDSKVVS